MNKKEVSIAYLAGLFDGEGSIHMSSHKPSATITVTFTNTNIDLCCLFADRWGGTISKYTSQTQPKAKQINKWFRSGHNAEPFIQAILPFSIAKKDIAELALKYLSLKLGRGHAMNPEIANQRLKISQSIYNAQQRNRLI